MFPLYYAPRLIFLLYLTASLFLFNISCADKEHKEIGFSIPGIESRISRVLINRNSFEGAVIKLLGKVKNLSVNERARDESTITNFQITDPKGNYINVHGTGILELNEDDVILLSGTYSSPSNTINLIEFEMVKPSVE